MNKKLYNEIINDMKAMNDREYINALKQLNTYNNIKEFEKERVDMDKVFYVLVLEALKRKLIIPSRGYIDLIALVEDIKRKK